MRPLDRHLSHLEPEFSREEENLGIETPTLNVLQGKDQLRGSPRERLEPALRVSKVQTEHDAQGEIEYPSKKLAMQWLALGLEFRPQPARSHGDIVAFRERHKKFVGLFDRRRQIGIAEQNHLAGGVQHPV